MNGRDKQLSECIAYFKENNGFDRLLESMQEKYQSYGYVGGRIVLEDVSVIEREAIEGLFQISIPRSNRVTLSMKQMQKRINQSRFDNVELDDLVLGYFGTIEVRKQAREKKKEKQNKLLMDCFRRFDGTIAGQWLLETMESKNNDYHFLIRKLQSFNDEQKFIRWLENGLKAGNHLPAFDNKKMRLSLFSANITGDPHYFDMGGQNEHIFKLIAKYILRVHFNQSIDEVDWLYACGIVKEEFINYVLVYGLNGFDNEGKVHIGIDGFNQLKEPMMLTVHTLNKVNSFAPIYPSKEVLVFENIGVMAEVFYQLKELDIDVPMICICGQPRLASYIVLDSLHKQGYQIKYTGDFDPEGLLISQKLKDRYENQCILWHYQKEDYLKSISKVTISEKRIKQMDMLSDDLLIGIAECIREYRKASYQEHLIEDYVNEMVSVYKN